MQILPIFQLSLIGVEDAGIPNKERVILRPTERVNLAEFGMLIGIQNQGFTSPLNETFFWFGEILIDPPSWLFIYTGKGEFRESQMPTTGEKAYVFHWGRPITAFNNPSIVPIIFRIGNVLVGNSRPALPYPPPSPPLANKRE